MRAALNRRLTPRSTLRALFYSLFVLLLQAPGANASASIGIGVSSGSNCTEVLNAGPQSHQHMYVGGPPIFLQNTYVGGCTVLWPQHQNQHDQLILTIESNHPRSVSVYSRPGMNEQVRFDTPVVNRPFQYRYFAIDISHTNPDAVIVIEQRGVFNVPVSLRTKTDFDRAENTFRFFAGSIFSIWILVIMLSFVTYIVSRRVAFIAYGLLAVASGMMVLSKTGFGQSLIWMNAPQLTDVLMSLSVPIGVVAIGLMFVTPLEAHINAPRLFKGLVIVFSLATVASGLGFFAGWHVFENLAHTSLVLPFLFLFIMTTAVCFRSRPVETSLVTLACLGLVVGVFISNLSNFGLIPSSLFVVRASEWGAIFDLAVALAMIGFGIYADNRRSKQLASEVLSLKERREADLELQVAQRTKSLHEISIEKTRLLQDFLAFSRYLTHDIRNPLTNIANQAMLIKGDVDADSSVGRRLLSMDRSIRRISNLFDDWLVIQRMSLGFHLPSFEPINLAKFIDEALSEVPHLDQIQKTLDINADHFQVYWDRKLMKRVLHNLLDNAKRYGDSEAGFELIVKSQGTGVEIQIIDYGTIPFEHIRSRLWRNKEGSLADMSDVGASGLGSAFVANAIRLHQGRIETESSLGGKGLRVKLVLLVSPKVCSSD